MVKATTAQLEQLLKTVGLAVQVVESDEDSDFSLDNSVSAIDDNRGKVLRPAIVEELRESSFKDAAGKFGGVIRNELAKVTGISRSQLDKIESDKDAIKAAFDYMQTNIQGDAAETKKKFDEITAQHKREIEDLQNAHAIELNSEKNNLFIRTLRISISCKYL